MEKDKKDNLRFFLIKSIFVGIIVVVVVNVIFNLIFAERLEKIDKVFSLLETQKRMELKDKIRNEIEDSLEKDQIIDDEDKIILYKFYKKIKKEFSDINEKK